MDIRHAAAAGGFIIASLLPLAASAQQAGSPPPASAPSAVTPSASKLQHRFNRLFKTLDLTNQQQQQIQSYIAAFAQQHPAGSPRDRRAIKALQRQVMGVLTPDQQARVKAEVQAQREERAQRRDASQTGPPQPQPSDAPPT